VTLTPEPVEATLRRAQLLVGKAVSFAVALGDLASIDLPAGGSELDAAQLRAVAALYLAAELERAGVLPAVEDLMRLARTGAFSVDMGAAAPLLERFWLSRNERATRVEREAFLSSLFGGGSGRGGFAFEDLFVDLCEALYKLDEQASNRDWGGVAQQTRVRTTAARLLDAVSRGTNGMTVFFATEVLDTLKAALQILTHKDVIHALGVRDVEDVAAAVALRVRRPAPGSWPLHLRRGRAGMTILAWLADAAALLGDSRPLLAIDHPVIVAAVEWLELSLQLTESPEEAGGRPFDEPELANAGAGA
jgi:hypothetical protein